MIDPNLNVLIVDDFEAMRFNMKSILKKLGMKNLNEATDGLDAWEKLEAAKQINRPYDIIFLDWNMPRMNGLEVLIKCKATEEHKKSFVIITTAEREQKSILEAMSKGANDYIVKPYNAETVIKKLMNYSKIKNESKPAV